MADAAPLDQLAARQNRTQWLLLGLAGLFIFLSMAGLSLGSSAPAGDMWTSFIIWLIAALSGGFILNRHLPQHDPLLFPLAMFLSGWGLVIIERLAPPFADRQALWLPLSTAALLLSAVFPHLLRWLRSYRYILLALTLCLLAATIVLGSNPSGLDAAPRLWLGIGGLYFQPSEVMKVILVAFLASYLGEQSATLRRREHPKSARFRSLGASPRLVGPVLLMWVLSFIILIWQRDLGTAMLFFIVFLLLLYMISGSRLILFGGALLVIAAALAAHQLFDVVQLRMEIWLDPWADPDGRAYQIVQSLMAFGAGGIFGTGVGLGLPDYIPVAHSDFVFAALA